MALDSDALVKQKIRLIVDLYKKDFNDEYQIVVRGIQAKKKMTRDEYASVEGTDEMRGLYEMSETLFTALVRGLDEDEMVWLKTKKGGRWFASTFREFALPDSI